jgi:hypothetical protein
MANVIIKSEERRAHEAYVLKAFGKGGCNVTRSDHEAAECIAARTREAQRELKRMEEKRK